jgi:hypothetical protein
MVRRGAPASHRHEERHTMSIAQVSRRGNGDLPRRFRDVPPMLGGRWPLPITDPPVGTRATISGQEQTTCLTQIA